MTVKNYVGTLNNELIENLCGNGILISKNYRKKNINQACYELSAGNIYYDVSENFKRIDIVSAKYDFILIRPKQSVVIITKEELHIPNDVIGRVLTKGKLFSIGLSPVNTYADPGFVGNLGITFHNNSVNYLKIKEGELIAKIEFSILQNPVTIPYHGQHGYKTNIWPLPVEFNLTEEEIKNDKRIGNAIDEIQQILGNKYTLVIKRLLTIEKTLLIGAIFYIMFSMLLLTILIVIDEKEWFTPMWSILAGLLSNIISFLVIAKLGKEKWF